VRKNLQLLPVVQAAAVVDSCARTMVNVSVDLDVTLMISQDVSTPEVTPISVIKK
jgi:hypothetical protein